MSRTGIMGTRFISCFSRLNIGAPELQLLAPEKWCALPSVEHSEIRN
jgi:hypothetical protein